MGGETLIRTHEGGVAHVAVALQAPSIASAKDYHALGLLQALLGGSGARGAAGAARLGPQRQSRIARSLHNEAHSFLRSLTSIALPYSDTGMIAIVGSAADHEAGRLVDVIAGFFKDAAGVGATGAELDRAKKSYKLEIASAMESRDGARDDIGAQILLTGKAGSVGDMFKVIDSLTAADVQKVAKAALASQPAIAAIGSLSTLPRYDVFASLLK